jgi:hypothetical protein
MQPRNLNTTYFLIWRGFEHTSARYEFGAYSNHEAAVTVDPTMARRLQSCWPFRVFQWVFPADAALGLSARIIGEKNTAVNRIFGQ